MYIEAAPVTVWPGEGSPGPLQVQVRLPRRPVQRLPKVPLITSQLSRELLAS